MLTPKIPPCYLTTNQSGGCPRADQALCDPLPHFVFKNPSLKATGEFGSFEHELPILLAWRHVGHFTINVVLSFTTPQYQEIGFTAWVSGPKFGLVTLSYIMGLEHDLQKLLSKGSKYQMLNI